MVKQHKNGAQIASGVTAAPVSVIRTLNYLGRSNTGTDAYFDGVLDGVRVYARALSAAEILALP